MTSPLGGRPGASTPRVPSSISRPGGEASACRRPRRSARSPRRRAPSSPCTAALSLPAGAEDEGPPDGLTLDVAIERLVRENLDLRSQSLEIPQAQADILTAGPPRQPDPLRRQPAHPLRSSPRRPGGPTQYDINITIPLDLNAQATGAGRRRLPGQAGPRGAVPGRGPPADRQPGYTAYVDVLAARETVRYAGPASRGSSRLRRVTEALRRRGRGDAGRRRPGPDPARLRGDRPGGRGGGATPGQAGPRPAPEPAARPRPRPWSSAGRSTTGRPRPRPARPWSASPWTAGPTSSPPGSASACAEADVRLAQAERFQDVFLLSQPYTFQDNAPFDRKSAHSVGPRRDRPPAALQPQPGQHPARPGSTSPSRGPSWPQLEQAVVTEVRQAERRVRRDRGTPSGGSSATCSRPPPGSATRRLEALPARARRTSSTTSTPSGTTTTSSASTATRWSATAGACWR